MYWSNRRILTSQNLTIGGISISLAGDWNQIPPVIERDSEDEIVIAYFRSSRLWPIFISYRLHTQVRAAQDPEYAAYVRTNGIPTTGPNSFGLHHNSFIYPDECEYATFPPEISVDTPPTSRCAILCVLNTQVDTYKPLTLCY